MKLIIVLFILCIAVISTASKCNKNNIDPNSDNGLPPATQTGANVFACRVNDSAWISKRSIFNLGGGVSKDTLYVHGSNPPSSSSYQEFDIVITNLSAGNNIYMLSDTSRRFGQLSTNKPCFLKSSGYGVGIGKGYNGELSLSRVDTVNKILSGTFWFNIKTDYCDTLKITDGRFDIEYYKP